MEFQGSSITPQNGYVLVVDPPDLDMRQLDIPGKLAVVAQCCAEVGTNKVLVLGTTANLRLSTLAIFEAGVEIAKGAFKLAVVYSDHNALSEDVAFIEDVVMNRGSEFRLFRDKAAAIEWLGVSDPTSD